MWWPVVSISRRWRPWWITPLRRICKRISIVWGARHAPGRHEKNVVWGESGRMLFFVIQFPCPTNWVSTGWRSEGWSCANGRSKIFCCKTSELLTSFLHLSLSLCLIDFVVTWILVCLSKIRRISQLLHMHHFYCLVPGGAYVYLRDSWWFGPFWEDASWERWLLGAYQTLMQSIQLTQRLGKWPRMIGTGINLKHSHHLFL